MEILTTLCLLVAFLSSCTLVGDNSINSNFYLPPTTDPELKPVLLVATPQPVLEQPLLPTSTPICIDNLRYIEDLSIPDGMQVSPGEFLDKRWRVENIGTCNWDSDYHLKNIAGPSLSAITEQALYPARSNTQANIRIIFTAPIEPGRYRSAWQAHNPLDQPFGDPIFIEFVVQPIEITTIP